MAGNYSWVALVQAIIFFLLVQFKKGSDHNETRFFMGMHIWFAAFLIIYAMEHQP